MQRERQRLRTAVPRHRLEKAAASRRAKRLWSAVPWHRLEGGGKPPHSEGLVAFAKFGRFEDADGLRWCTDGIRDRADHAAQGDRIEPAGGRPLDFAPPTQSGENHREGAELTAERIQGKPKRFQCERSEKGMVSFLSEDHVSNAHMMLEPKYRTAFAPTDRRPVWESKLLPGDRFDPKVVESRRRHD